MPFTRRIFTPMMGEGVLLAEGEAWRRQRKLVQPIFHATVIHEFTQTFVEYAESMVSGWQAGETLRLYDEFMGLALRIINQTMFGEDVEALTDRIGVLMGIITEEAQAQLGQAVPLPAWLPTPGRRRQRRALDEIHALLLDIIYKRRVHVENGGEPGSDLLALLLQARDEAGDPMSEREILDECLTLFFAGHETTAVAMTWTWYLLLTHPEALEKLRAEVERVLGDAPVAFESLQRMPYGERVVKEALRLHPPVPGVARTPIEPFAVGGATVRPGDTLLISAEVLHRQAEFYPEPERFRPDRWGPDQPQPPRYAYLPFSAGPRTCIGNGFAMLEMQAVLATMVQRMQRREIGLSLVPGQEIVPVRQVTVRPSGGVMVRVEDSRSVRRAHGSARSVPHEEISSGDALASQPDTQSSPTAR